MNRHSLSIAFRLATLSMLISIASASVAQPPDGTSVARVLQDVRAHAAEANYDAEVLYSYSKSGVSWESHSMQLNEIRRHINDLFRDYSKLQNMTDNATPKQRDAINRLEPILWKMVHSLTETMQNLTENQKNVNMPLFRARIHSDYLNISQVYRELCKCTGDHA